MEGVAVICAPLFMPQEFPLNVWYPFSMEPLLRKFILYVTHILATAHTVFCLNVDIMMAVFFLYSAARLEMLAFEIEQATDETHVISSIKKHQEIIEFTSKTQCTLQYILFKTNFTMAFTVISGGFPILYLQPHSFALVPQYITMPIGALQRMFITAWTADDLKEISTRLSWSVYSASWIGKTQKMKSDICIMLQRNQQPLLITMSSLLPALTLEYYADFVTKVLSYFMTMRVVIAT
ncbi:Odorant receptor 10 [Formica fusca]